MHLYCKKCNQQLTAVELQQTSPDKANLEDGAILIDPGFYVDAGGIEIHFGQPIDFLVNKKSVMLRNHNDRRRLQGCCGPGDLSVLNQVCPKCSAEIGVIIEDCWLPHFVGISGETVTKEPLW